MWRPLVLTVVVLAAHPVPTLVDGPSADTDEALFERHLGLELERFESTALPPKATLELIGGVTAGGEESLRTASVFRAKTGESEVRLVRMRTELGELFASSSERGRLERAALVDEEGETGDWSMLFVQIGQRPAIGLEGAESHVGLAAKRERLAASDDAAERLGAALAVQRESMVNVLAGFRDVSVALDEGEPAADAIEEVAKRVDRLGNGGVALEALLGDSGAAYREAASDVVSILRAASKTARAGGDPAGELRSVRAACSRCHKITVGADEHPVRERSRALRADHGLGGGVFLLGYDLVPVTADPEAEQVVATAVRRAVLLLSEAAR